MWSRTLPLFVFLLVPLIASAQDASRPDDRSARTDGAPPASGLVYEGPSMFGRLFVRDRAGVRSLIVGDDQSIEQSAIRLGEPLHLVHEYNRLFVAAVAATDSVQRVLVLGLGGGSLPRFLLAHFPRMQVDAVEIDPAVVEAAERFFELRPGPRLRLHVADALAFLEQSQARWDLIVLDAYAPDSVPEHLATPDFLRLARSRLNEGGVLASNVWGPPSPQYERLLNTHREVLDPLLVLDGREDLNRIFLGSQRPLSCAALSEAIPGLGLPFSLQETVAAGCSEAQLASPPASPER